MLCLSYRIADIWLYLIYGSVVAVARVFGYPWGQLCMFTAVVRIGASEIARDSKKNWYTVLSKQRALSLNYVSILVRI